MNDILKYSLSNFYKFSTLKFRMFKYVHVRVCVCISKTILKLETVL
jgi:hypothetical protein